MYYELEAEPFEWEAGEDAEFGEETEPELGYDSELEAEEPEAGLVYHPTLGYGQLVSAEEELEEEIEGEEEILGADSRQRVTDTKKAPYRWICALELYFSDPDNKKLLHVYRGSGTLISEKHVLTAGHNLLEEIIGSKGTRKRTKVKKVVVTPGRDGAAATAAGKAPFGTSNAAKVVTSVAWEAAPDYLNDYGMIKLQKSLGRGSTGYWGSAKYGQKTQIDLVAAADTTGKIINVSGYPGDKCKDKPANGSATRAQLAACSMDDRASTQWRASGTVVKVISDYPALIHHDADTYKGHSGGPVWFYYPKAGIRNLIGIHTGRWPRDMTQAATANRAIRITKKVLDDVKKWM